MIRNYCKIAWRNLLRHRVENEKAPKSLRFMAF
jgi:hypothetical protein